MLDLDLKATRMEVERLLEQVRLIKEMGVQRLEQKTTAKYSDSPRSGQVSNPVETIGLINVMNQQQSEHILISVSHALNQLNSLENKIIEIRYLTHEMTMDPTVWNMLEISERKYYRIKARAIYKMAFLLRLDKYREDIA